jgi:replication factor A1
VPAEGVQPIVFYGIIIHIPGGTFIDNGTDRYLMDGNTPHGTLVRVTGTLSGSRIIAATVEPLVITPDEVMIHLQQFREQLNS